jgi:hypothetical protein
MPYQATVYNVMIASPGDVLEEREAVRNVIHRWNSIHSQPLALVLQPVGWESHSIPLMGSRPQQILNEQIVDECDLLVGIFWTRLGTPTGKADSGSVEEIERHTKKKRPAMLYFSDKPVELSSVDMEQYQSLVAYKDLCKVAGLFEGFSNTEKFIEKFDRQLSKLVNSSAYFQRQGTLDTTQAPTLLRVIAARLSDDSKKVLFAAVSDTRTGSVYWQESNMGTSIQAGGECFGQGADHRTQARWLAAAQELSRAGLIGTLSRNKLTELTKLGYDVVDLLVEHQTSQG